MLSPSTKKSSASQLHLHHWRRRKGLAIYWNRVKTALKTSAKSLANNQSYRKTQMVTVSTTFGFLAFGLRCLGTVWLSKDYTDISSCDHNETAKKKNTVHYCPLLTRSSHHDSEVAVGGAPNMRKLRSLLPTAKYEASGPKRTDVTFPADRTMLVSESTEQSTWKTWHHSLWTSSLWRNTRKEMNADVLSRWIMDNLEI